MSGRARMSATTLGRSDGGQAGAGVGLRARRAQGLPGDRERHRDRLGGRPDSRCFNNANCPTGTRPLGGGVEARSIYTSVTLNSSTEDADLSVSVVCE